MPTNPFTIADLYSKNKAKDGCLDQQLPPDPKQDWSFVPNSCTVTTLQFARKHISCAAYRDFETGDASDKQFSDGGPMALHAAYLIYYGSDMLISGYAEFDEFTVP
jgi:hypothetical protein